MIKQNNQEEQKIIKQTLEFFKKNYNLTICHPTTTFDYSVKNISAQIDTGNVVCLANTSRKEDKGKPYSLTLFSMLIVRQLFPSIYGNPLNMFLHYLKDFCKADMSSIGIVGLSRNVNFNIFGIQPYLQLFHKYKISTDNILIRTDYQKAYNDGTGDGWWRDKVFPSKQYETIAIYVKLKSNSDIKNYSNVNDWLEVCEACSVINNNSECGSNGMGFGAGMERILYHFFKIPIKWN